MRAIVVGSGISGLTAAILLREQGYNVEIFETKEYIGGHCADEWRTCGEEDILTQMHGPHVFHTDKEDVFKFISRYTKLNNFYHAVVAKFDDWNIPFPFNEVSQDLVGDWSDEEIRQNLFVNYSEKHWGIPWSELPQYITTRRPVRRKGRDCRYHLEPYQGIPEGGWHKLFEAMSEGFKIHLSSDKDDWKKQSCDLVVYTGPIDQYFNYCLGNLGYRTLILKHKEERKRKYPIVNWVQAEPSHTRSYDNSHWLNQNVETSIVTYEYPTEYDAELNHEPYYPKTFGPDVDLARQYREMAKLETNTIFLGRLATYSYIDSHIAIKIVLDKIGAAND